MRRLTTLAAVLLALVVLYVAGWKTQPTAAAPPTGTESGAAGNAVAVSSVTRTCPPPAPNNGVAQLAVIAMPGQATASAGEAQLSPVPLAGPGTTQGTPATVTVSRPSALTLATAPASTQFGGTAVAATGTMAQGFEAEQVTPSGMATVACTHPGSDMWFVGTGEQTGAPLTRLYLMNTGSMAASVEVTMLTDTGIEQGLSSAISVAPGQYLIEDITQYTHGSQVLALHVQTSSGQVAADVWQGPSRGGSSGAWLPQAAPPATRVVIPGLTAAANAARLLVTVPGSVDANVTVTALTAQGQFKPLGAAPQVAPSGVSSSFALTSLGGSAAALVLTSNVPITAGLEVAGNGIGSFSAAAVPVTDQGVVAGNPAGG